VVAQGLPRLLISHCITITVYDHQQKKIRIISKKKKKKANLVNKEFALKKSLVLYCC
jgi:hypothetical protein